MPWNKFCSEFRRAEGRIRQKPQRILYNPEKHKASHTTRLHADTESSIHCVGQMKGSALRSEFLSLLKKSEYDNRGQKY
jgi:hypothetical protein